MKTILTLIFFLASGGAFAQSIDNDLPRVRCAGSGNPILCMILTSENTLPPKECPERGQNQTNIWGQCESGNGREKTASREPPSREPPTKDCDREKTY